MELSRPDLTVSIISADNLALLLPCLRSVFESTHGVTLEVFLVDNASADGSAEAVQAEFPEVKVIRNSARLGFSTNNNLVLRQGQGRYLMLLNDDTVVLSDALDRLVAFADGHPEVAVVGAGLLNPDNSYQQAYARFPHPLTEAFVTASYFSALDVAKRKSEQPFAVDIVSGACLMVRREVVEQVGMLDTDFDPIYSEEFDWCYRIKKEGWEIYTLPEAKVVHYGSYTMNRAPARKLELLNGKKVLFFQKHYGVSMARAFKVLLFFVSLAKASIWQLRWLAGNPLAKEKASAHCHLTRCALFLKT